MLLFCSGILCTKSISILSKNVSWSDIKKLCRHLKVKDNIITDIDMNKTGSEEKTTTVLLKWINSFNGDLETMEAQFIKGFVDINRNDIADKLQTACDSMRALSQSDFTSSCRRRTFDAVSEIQEDSGALCVNTSLITGICKNTTDNREATCSRNMESGFVNVSSGLDISTSKKAMHERYLKTSVAIDHNNDLISNDLELPIVAEANRLVGLFANQKNLNCGTNLTRRHEHRFKTEDSGNVNVAVVNINYTDQPSINEIDKHAINNEDEGKEI